MLLYIIILVLALPFIDLYILIQAADILGILPTVGLIIFTGVLGAYILKRESELVGMKLVSSVTAKEVSRNLLEGFLLVIGGIMLLTPGFLTDLLGLIFLIGPTRIRITIWLQEKIETNSNLQVEVGRF